MTSRRIKLLAPLLAFSVIAAACGDDDDESADEPAEEPADDADLPAEEPADDAADDAAADEPADEAAAAGDSILGSVIPCDGQHEGTAVSILSPVRDTDDDQPVADFVGAYDPLAECTGVEITWEGTDQFETEVNVRLSGGNPPDIIDYPQPGLMRSHVERDFLVPLTQEMDDFVRSEFSEGFYSLGEFEGTLYTVPVRTNVKSLVWYSPSAFADAGYETPETMDELTALSDQIVTDGGTPWCIGIESGVATGWVLTDWIEDFTMRYAGGEVYDQWVTHEIPFNDPAMLEVYDAVAAFTQNPDYLGDENAVKAVATTKFQDGGLPIVAEDGSCYMHRQASFYNNSWPEGTVIAEDGDIWFFQLPGQSSANEWMLIGGDLYGATSDDQAVLDVLLFGGTAEYQLAIANSRNEPAANSNVDPADLQDPYIQILSELLLNSGGVRFDGADAMPGAVGAGTFWQEVTEWQIGNQDTETFAGNVEASWP